jgi:segregation and condensation protein B
MTANNLDRVVPQEKSGRGASLLLPFPSKTVMALPSADRREKLRILEALLFASPEPLDQAALAQHFGQGEDVAALLEELQGLYAGRGVNLMRVAGKWAFRTAEDLAFLLERQAVEQRRLSRAALETLAIIAYHQPVTRAEIEEIRGVGLGKGTIDTLMEAGWVRPKGRRMTPGRPLLWVTTSGFLAHFGLDTLSELPAIEELRLAGLLDLTPTVLGEGGLGGDDLTPPPTPFTPA